MSYDSTINELEFFSKNPIAEAEHPPLIVIVTLVGPIRYWWGERWNTSDHRRYVEHRDAVRLALAILPGVAVYSPHRAFQGAWHPLLQTVNDTAIRMSNVLVDLTPDWLDDMVAEGTAEEVAMAERLTLPVLRTFGRLDVNFIIAAVDNCLKLTLE